MSNDEITIATVVAAPVAQVWTCYTEPEHITRWNFASDDWCCPSAANELRAGGRYRARMEAKDGSAGFDFEATYDEVCAGETLAYTIADGRKVKTTFAAKGGTTTVTTNFEAEQVHPVELQREGWQAILDNFKRYVEASRGAPA